MTKYILQCPECNSEDIDRKIIGTEFETYCKKCDYYNSTDYFNKEVTIFDKTKKKHLKRKTK